MKTNRCYVAMYECITTYTSTAATNAKDKLVHVIMASEMKLPIC